MQIQELQKQTQELKKLLLAERKAKETAQKKAEELEVKLAQAGAPPGAVAGQGVPPEGVFEDIRYPALLARCRAEAFTGAIVMQSGGATRTVYLRDGLPVGFLSSEPGERIGKVLVSQGRITDEQYMKAATRMVERSIKLTDALVELGLIDGEALAVEQRNLSRDQIIQSFELVQGRFTVVSGQAPDQNTASFDFGPGEIYVQGYRRYAPSTEMMAAYETLRDRYLTSNSRLSAFRPKLGLNPDDERILRLLGEALTVEEAVERSGVSPEAAARLLCALQALDLVEEWTPGVEQFRTRIRDELRRHMEAVSAVEAAARKREDRLVEAFEKALSKVGSDAGVVSSTAAENKRDERKPAVSTSSASSSVAQATSAPAASVAVASSATASPTAQSSIGATGAAAQAQHATSSASAPVTSAASAQSTLPSSGSSSSMAATTKRAEPTVSAAAGNGRAKADSEMSLADLKYKEGIDQAAQSRLDEAEVTLREAVRLDASRPEYLTALARVLLTNPRYERSGTLPVVRSLLDRAVQIAPDHQEAVDLQQQVAREMS